MDCDIAQLGNETYCHGIHALQLIMVIGNSLSCELIHGKNECESCQYLTFCILACNICKGYRDIFLGITIAIIFSNDGNMPNHHTKKNF